MKRKSILLCMLMSTIVLSGNVCAKEKDPDDNTRVMKIVTTDENGAVTETEYFQYDDEGRRISRVALDAEGNLISNSKYSYDVDTEISISYENGELDYISYELTNENEDTLENYSCMYDSDGETNMLDINSYDDDGNLLRAESCHITDGEYNFSITRTEEYTYENGVLIQKKEYDPTMMVDELGREWVDTTTYTYSGDLLTDETTTGSGTSSIHYSYDENGNVIKEEENEQDILGETSTVTDYVYDADGNVLEEKMEGTNAEGDKHSSISMYKYDADGNVVLRRYERVFISGSISKSETEYVYDENGNCIEERVSRERSDGGITTEVETKEYADYTNYTYEIDFSDNVITEEELELINTKRASAEEVNAQNQAMAS